MARQGCLLLAALVVFVAAPAAAQDRVTLFLHGFSSNAATWQDTAARLAARLQITPVVPELPWHLPFDTQASHLNGLATGAPADMVAIGHSNGGLVARQLSTKRALGGLVTLGTPHEGAPLVRNARAAGVFYLVTTQKLGALLHMLGAVGNNQYTGIWFSPGLAPLRTAIAALGLTLEQAAAIGQYLLPAFPDLPVMADMAPGSAALASLNSAGNLARERAAVPKRVGLVFAATDWWKGGPFVAVAPERQDQAQSAVVTGILFLGYIRAYFDYPNVAPWDPYARSIRDQTSSIITDLLSFNAAWCWATSNDPSCATSSDGVVPTPSQYFPGNAVNLGFYGPAHVQQTARAEAPLFDALVRHVELGTRTGSGGGSPGGGGTGGAPQSTLTADERLYPGQAVWSPNGSHSLHYQGDGNLVLYGPSGPVWSSDTHTTSAGFATMQGDGNFVVYDASGQPVWATDTAGLPGAELRVQDDGYIVLYDAGGHVLWYGPQ
jgi:pimeloyl-ACP methyl ester carboxylesterase